jgi:hypothetical protein
VSHEYERASGYLKGYWNDTTFDLLQELTNGNQYANGTGGLWSRQKVILYGAGPKKHSICGKAARFFSGPTST